MYVKQTFLKIKNKQVCHIGHSKKQITTTTTDNKGIL